ncbi:vomeronasal type-2 receptor 26-like [Dendropsophus ebraccatus]|uniref:vomeronasal type-2 receptor 26-like n=1 Tax=Dendropsophus ebraccatus TaxID=150705 RepID=UPI0038312399
MYYFIPYKIVFIFIYIIFTYNYAPVLFLCVTPYIVTSQSPAPSCRLQIQEVYEDYEYVQDGDIMVGGVVTVHSAAAFTSERRMLCTHPITYYYENLLSFFYSVDEINKYSSILPNLTLGYHIYDSCADPRKAIKSILQILSGPGHIVPNYSCTRKKKKVVGFIGDHFSSTTLPIAQLLGIYPYSQISYGATNTMLSERSLFPSIFRTVPSDYTTYSTLCGFLSYFGWTWVGIISSDDDDGDRETMLLTNLLTSHGICVAYVIKCTQRYLDYVKEDIGRSSEMIKKSSAQIIIICGTFSFFMQRFFDYFRRVLQEKTLILNPTFSPHVLYEPVTFNLSLLFDLKKGKMPDMENYFKTFHPLKNPKDMILENIWIKIFHCSSGKMKKDELFAKKYGVRLHKCDGTEQIEDILLASNFATIYQMYLAVWFLANAFHQMYISHGHQSTDHQLHLYTHKVHSYIEALKCGKEPGRKTKCFSRAGDKAFSYILINVFTRDIDNLTLNTVGTYNLKPRGVIEFEIYKEDIIWKNSVNKVPKSQCSANCSPGQRKVTTFSIHLCCYDCAQCPDGEISNISDSENCRKCPEDAWSNENRTLCVMKEMEYLSYTEDIISIAFSSLATFFWILTLLILLIFVSQRDTAIVRANNKNLSFVLLVSIMLSFLSVFLFLGRPVDTTCRIRQISTGILLSVSISSLLAKTIMVYMAFRATKPGSVWSRWSGVKLPNCVLLICSSVQGVICMSWVTLSPPFQELDTHSYKEKMVVQCNEGSDLCFYSVLCYMGILAAVSFITAFLARTLPDSFNEAKYITFSMLVFCSVWIAMIPAYLSTKGKYMVAVEIFAILTSNAGLLGCIFFPKCYILLFKPELNTRKHILGSKNAMLHH